MSIEGQGHFFTIYFPGFVCFVLYLAKISGERLQDHWSSGLFYLIHFLSLMGVLEDWKIIDGIDLIFFLAKTNDLDLISCFP